MKYIKKKDLIELLKKEGAKDEEIPELLKSVEESVIKVLEESPFISESIYQFRNEGEDL